MIRCQHCGHEVPEGSVFCNHCGYRMNNQVTCSYCHQPMPSTSVFCPHCGKAIEDAMNATPQEGQATEEARPQAPKGRTYNEQRQERQRQAARKQANAWEQPKPVEPDDDDDDDDDDNGGGGRSHYDRNLIIGIAAVVILIALLSMLRHCNSQENDRLQERADSAAIAADNSQDPMAVFSAELSRNGMTQDKAYTGCAVKFTDGDKPERIVGVTYKDDTDRPFIKVYTLTRDGAQWKTELTQTKYFDGRIITMDNSSLIADNLNIPRQVTDNGKQYLYFGFLNHLKGAGEGSNGRVTLCLYDIDGKNLTTLTYDGTIRSRTDGRQYVHCRGPLESINTNERRLLQQEAAHIGAIHVATQEEIDAEEEAKAKEEEEKALEGEENADAKWDHDNAENMDKLKEGEEVKMKPTQYDKPIINMKEIKEKLENDRYLVFLDTKGSVVGFNKSSRKYFTIYAGKNASGISFSGDNTVHIKTPSGSINYDLVHDKAKSGN